MYNAANTFYILVRHIIRVDYILDILERKYSIYVILAVRNYPGSTKTEILRLDPGNERTKFLRINDLIEAGIVMVSEERKQHNAMRLYLTPKGQEVANYLDKIALSISN